MIEPDPLIVCRDRHAETLAPGAAGFQPPGVRFLHLVPQPSRPVLADSESLPARAESGPTPRAFLWPGLDQVDRGGACGVGGFAHAELAARNQLTDGKVR